MIRKNLFTALALFALVGFVGCGKKTECKSDVPVNVKDCDKAKCCPTDKKECGSDKVKVTTEGSNGAKVIVEPVAK